MDLEHITVTVFNKRCANSGIFRIIVDTADQLFQIGSVGDIDIAGHSFIRIRERFILTRIINNGIFGIKNLFVTIKGRRGCFFDIQRIGALRGIACLFYRSGSNGGFGTFNGQVVHFVRSIIFLQD